MLELFIGALAGIITSWGMGGGTILILLLTIICKYEQQTAQGINLIFFIPSAIIAIIIYIKEKSINFKLCALISSFGIIGACIGANIATYIQTNQLKKWFAIFLFFIAIHEIYSFYNKYINKKKRNNIIKK